MLAAWGMTTEGQPVLVGASRGWRGVVMTPVAVRQLHELRRQLFSPTTVEEVPTDSTEAVTAAA